MIKQILAKKSEILLTSVILLAIYLRFVNYLNRWGLAYDQARDVLVGTYALNNHLIPLIGPFSSAGQFVYGPQWFWVISIFTSVFPYEILTPWIIQSILYVFVVYVMFLIGKEIINKNFGLLVAFFTAISIGQINQSVNLTSPSMVGIFSIFSFYFFIRTVKYSKNLDVFLLGFLVANTINIHFQAIGLLTLLPIAFLFSKRKLRQLLVLGIGFLIPFIPLLIFDLKTNFFETRHMLDYYFYGQNKIYVPNRWLTYVGYFWPKSWSDIIGGHIFFGYFSIILISVISIYEIIKRKISKEMLASIISFFLIFVMLRYYKGEIFTSYLTFIHPFILIFTAWVFYKISKLNKYVFAVFLILITVTVMQVNYKGIVNAVNLTAKYEENWKNVLVNKYPDKKFAIYDYQYKFSGLSLPLSLYLYNKNKIDDNGIKIGVLYASFSALMELKDFPKIYGNSDDFLLIDLNASSGADLEKNGWVFVNPSRVYNSTENWYIKDK